MEAVAVVSFVMWPAAIAVEVIAEARCARSCGTASNPVSCAATKAYLRMPIITVALSDVADTGTSGAASS